MHFDAVWCCTCFASSFHAAFPIFPIFSSKLKAEAGMDRMTQRHMPWNPATWHATSHYSTSHSASVEHPTATADPGRDLVPHRVAEPSHVLPNFAFAYASHDPQGKARQKGVLAVCLALVRKSPHSRDRK